jgi:hypothetical protein
MPSPLLTNLTALGVVAARVPLARLGILHPGCPWRRVTGIGLRATGSKFTLATFGLNSGFDGLTLSVARRRLRRRLYPFFKNEPWAPLRVLERRGCRVGVPGGEKWMSFMFFADVIRDPKSRFVPPALCSTACAGEEVVDVHCRLSPDLRVVDVWMQFHHAIVDGAPMWEMMSRLEQAWGKAEEVTYPAPGERATAGPWHLPGERPVHHALDFVDFAPLLASRQAIKGRQPVTVSALLTWCLARQPGFEGKRIASTVDVPALGREPRCVDFVVVRPGDFRRFDDYVREFNRQVAACRARTTETARMTRALALLPPRLALAALRANAAKRDETFGTVGLTILRDAPVFLAPYADLGFDDGFLAIGSMDLPTADGRRVGAASAKGELRKPEQLLAALRAAVSNCGDDLAGRD